MKHNKIFQHKIGFVWKIEHTELKGYHFHWLFFFKEAKVQNSIHKSFEIGKYWRDVITKKKGIFFSCNAKMHKYRYLGIGRIHASSPEDAALRDNLYNRVVRYLTKRDQFLKVKLGPGYRIFGKGEVPEKSNVGRPRIEYQADSGLMEEESQGHIYGPEIVLMSDVGCADHIELANEPSVGHNQLV